MVAHTAAHCQAATTTAVAPTSPPTAIPHPGAPPEVTERAAPARPTHAPPGTVAPPPEQ